MRRRYLSVAGCTLLLIASLLVIALECQGSFFGGDTKIESAVSEGLQCTPTLPQEHPASNPYTTVVEPFDLVVPSGNRVYGLIRRPNPAFYPGLCFPAVVFVPGGINPGRMEIRGEEAILAAAAGMVVIAFNAEGRVSAVPGDLLSEGDEDYNGYRQQDSLCAIVSYAMNLPYVISGNVGIKTQSYGITMGAGCAGRHPEISIKYLVDGEGPPNSFVTSHEPLALDGNDKYELVHGIMGYYSTYRSPLPDTLAFWEEREAERFIGTFRGRYLRLQAQWDHAQPPASEAEIPTYHQPPLWWHNKHTADMVNAAVAGGVPWVRVNLPEQGNAVNATYDLSNHGVSVHGGQVFYMQTNPPQPTSPPGSLAKPAYIPGLLSEGQPWGVLAILEMARMARMKRSHGWPFPIGTGDNPVAIPKKINR